MIQDYFIKLKMEVCDICCDKYTSQLRKPIECKFCNYKACTACVKNYLTTIVMDPKCMKCAVAWDPEFIDSILSKHFRVGELKKHRELILLEREKIKLPETMILVEIELDKRKKEKEIEEMMVQRTLLLKQAEELNLEMYNMRLEIRQPIPGGSRTYTFTRACPSEGCRGYLNSSYTCEICEVHVCKTCHEIKDIKEDEEHICKPENIETAKLLAKDSKPCPKCSCMIFKIDGCNQIWCTQCHTAFDWKSGQLTTGVVHNPHYFEWMRNQGEGAPREHVDENCGDNEPEYWTLVNHIKQKKITRLIF